MTATGDSGGMDNATQATGADEQDMDPGAAGSQSDPENAETDPATSARPATNDDADLSEASRRGMPGYQ